MISARDNATAMEPRSTDPLAEDEISFAMCLKANWLRAAGERFVDRPPLISPLLCELMLVCGHQSGVIGKVEIDRSFAVAWRGPAALPTDGTF